MQTEYVKNFLGQILGYVETDLDGNKAVYNFPMRQCLGRYNKDSNMTTDFLGRILGYGDFVVSLLYKDNNFPIK